MNKYFDVHGHLTDFSSIEVEDILSMLRENRVYMNCSGVDLESSKKSVEYSVNNFDIVTATIAVHPNSVQDFEIDLVKKEMYKLAENNAQYISGIGECGLDLHYDRSYIDLQYKWLEMHAELANYLNVPIIFHIRDAHHEMINFLKKNKSLFNKLTIIIHCFNEGEDVYKEYKNLNLNIYFSISGIVTFKKTELLAQCVKNIPLEHILSETDSPFLAPTPMRGKKNFPYYVKYVVEKIAELKKMPSDLVSKKIFDNAFNLFRKNKL